MSNQMHRFLTAFLGLALALAAVPLSKQLTAYTKAPASEQAISSDGSSVRENLDEVNVQRYTTATQHAAAFEHSFDSELVVQDLFERVSGSQLSTEVPSEFIQEVMPVPTNCTYLYSNHDVVGFVVAQSGTSLQNDVIDTLLGNGWQRVDVDTSAQLEKTHQLVQCSFAKSIGTYQWLHVAFYPMASTTTCVFTLHRKDNA